METKFKVGDEVTVEFMGVITSIELDSNGKVSYGVHNRQSGKPTTIFCIGLDEDKIIPLPTEK